MGPQCDLQSLVRRNYGVGSYPTVTWYIWKYVCMYVCLYIHEYVRLSGVCACFAVTLSGNIQVSIFRIAGRMLQLGHLGPTTFVKD